MIPPSFGVAHVGTGVELTALGYLVLVLLHLLGIGAVALVVSRLLGVLGTGRSAVRGG